MNEFLTVFIPIWVLLGLMSAYYFFLIPDHLEDFLDDDFRGELNISPIVPWTILGVVLGPFVFPFVQFANKSNFKLNLNTHFKKFLFKLLLYVSPVLFSLLGYVLTFYIIFK